MKEPIGGFEIKDKDLAGRIGKLRTPHGILETPALLPVIDTEKQELPIEDIEKLGFKAVITNAYLLWKRMRRKALEKGVHGILGFKGIVMTDSGAYQILRYGSVDIDAIEVVEFQKSIGSDIAVILDEPTGNVRSRLQAERSVEETLRRAWISLNHIDSERVWVLPIQGGSFIDLVEKSAKEASRIPRYHMYALGSPTVHLERYEYNILLDMLFHAKLNLPLTRPLHLFGAGHPMIIPFAVALGADVFDSASYILYARDNRYMTFTRTYRLSDLDYFPCSCPVCIKYEPKELIEMPKNERVKLLALHNLYVLRQAILEVKVAIREGRLWELLEERSRVHPSLYKAFKNFKKYSEWLLKISPQLKGGEVHGLFFFNEEGLWRPEVLGHNKRLLTMYKPERAKNLLLVAVNLSEKPLTRSNEYSIIKKKFASNSHIVFYIPYFGAVPEELAETYPLSQFEVIEPLNNIIIEETAKRVVEYIETHRRSYEKILLLVNKNTWYSIPVAKRIKDMLTSKGIGIEVLEYQE